MVLYILENNHTTETIFELFDKKIVKQRTIKNELFSIFIKEVMAHET